MNSVVLASFIDELSKIAGANVASPFKATMGQNIATGLATMKSGFAKSLSGPKPTAAKSTNYSIVHSEAPSAAYGSALSSKSVPPPPVRT